MSYGSLSKKLKHTMNNIDLVLNDDNMENLSMFKTDFGINFCISYNSLSEYVSCLALSPIVLDIIMNISNSFFTDQGIDFIHKQIEEEKELNTSQKEKSKNIIVEILNLYDSLKKTIPSIDFKSDENELKQLELIFNQFGILKRSLDYFIISLFSYLDLYSMILIQKMISSLGEENIYYAIKNAAQATNPQKNISIALKNIPLHKSDAKGLLDYLIEDEDWQTERRALEEFISLRNRIAHGKPVSCFADIKEKFNQLNKNISKNLDRLINNLNIEKLPFKFKEIITKNDLELHDLIFVIELGKACCKYIALIDNIYFLIIEENNT